MTTKHTVSEGSIQFGLLLHNHQPVGNFPQVLQQIYEESYLPMLQALERYPDVRLSLHYSGSLLDWIVETHPDSIERIAALAQRGQIELVSGGYYEPILPSIPERDQIGQITRLTTRLEQLFGVRPTGMWLAERVWEPSLPRILQAAGIEWTIVDDIHFKNVGLEDSDLYGYYATEDQSEVLKVYATSKTLRYTIPWRSPEETIAALHALKTVDGQRIAVMGDDGEKFGSWPETQKYCWGGTGSSGWVDEFFQALTRNQSWLHTIPLGEYAQQQPALGRIYLPTSSYLEMSEWALPPRKSYQFQKLRHQLEKEKRGTILQFIQGGFWRNFLVRYAEINTQHKKMLRVHERVYQAGGTEAQGLTQLWKAQANDTYWHGLFGGIYMAHVRSAIYHHLIQAENMADQTLHGSTPWQQYEWSDFARDTQNKLLIESDQQNLYIDPHHGGSLFEWDLRRSAHNALCVMTRYQESYHQILREHEQEQRRQKNSAIAATKAEPESPHTTIRTKEPDLDRYLTIDSYRRASLIDHFLPIGLPAGNFARGHYEDQGTFADQPYEVQVTPHEQGLDIRLTRTGQVRRAGALSPLTLSITKTLFVPIGEERLEIRYLLENKSQARLQTIFASEWNINLLGGGHNPQAYCQVEGITPETYHFDSNGENAQVAAFHVGNTWLQQDIHFLFSKPATLWRYSIETVTGSESGFERTHQGSCFLPHWLLHLEAGESWQAEIVIQGSGVKEGNKETATRKEDATGMGK